MGVIDEYYFPLLKDLVVNVMGDVLYGGWETFPEIRCEQNIYALNTLQNKQVWKLLKECHEEGGEKRMETERLVGYLYQVKGYIEGGSQNLQVGPIKEIIESLRRGEKFKNFAKFKEMYYTLKNKIYTKGGCGISADIDEIERKYLSRPDKKEKVLELVKELDKDVRELLKMLEEKMGD